jgi:hypothetical protein
MVLAITAAAAATWASDCKRRSRRDGLNCSDSVATGFIAAAI